MIEPIVIPCWKAHEKLIRLTISLPRRKRLKGVLIDFIYHLLFVDLKQLSWLEFTLINYSESSDNLLLIFIVKITHLIKANQRKSLS